jgi:hypothetical protein
MDKVIPAYANNTPSFQTLVTTTANTSAAINATRILITAGAQTQFVEFGTNPTATANSFCIPANNTLQFNFVSGQKVSALGHAAGGYVTIVNMGS